MTLKNDYLHSLMLKFISKTFVRKRQIIDGSWNNEKTVVLSFDCDYPKDMLTCAQIMQTLKQHKVPAGFALTGKLVQEFPQVVESIIANEHEIINHTYTHYPEFRNLPSETKLEEITSFQSLLKDSFGLTVKGFRAPHLRQGKQADLFSILKNLSLFDSSLIGYGVKDIDGVVEIPLTPFPDVEKLPFCTYHHFRMPLLSASENSFVKRWETLLSERDFINVYLDPIDFVDSTSLLDRLITLASQHGFCFSRLQDVAGRVSN